MLTFNGLQSAVSCLVERCRCMRCCSCVSLRLKHVLGCRVCSSSSWRSSCRQACHSGQPRSLDRQGPPSRLRSPCRAACGLALGRSPVRALASPWPAPAWAPPSAALLPTVCLEQPLCVAQACPALACKVPSSQVWMPLSDLSLSAYREGVWAIDYARRTHQGSYSSLDPPAPLHLATAG